MNKLSPRILLQQFYRHLMMRSMRELDVSELGRSAIVFAPHQDDETLGCGGTIIRKKKAGADLQIVFMTDGCRSHSHLMPEDGLRSVRAREAIAAAQTLGVEQNDVIFLGFKDRELDKNQGAGTRKVAEILLCYQPKEIFIPYHKEAPSDHVATNQIVISALKMCGVNAIVYEYPIWFWYHWPWTSLVGSYREILSIFKNSLIASLGLSCLKDFRCSVYIGDVLEYKHTALDQHQSQMKRLAFSSDWLTLSDVSNGEFLECFFQDYEFFYQYSLAEKYLKFKSSLLSFKHTNL